MNSTDYRIADTLPEAIPIRPPIRLKRAAKLLDVSPSAVYALIAQGLIPYSKPGGKLIYFEEDDLMAYLRKNRVDTERK